MMGFYIGLAMALLPFLIFIFVLHKKKKLLDTVLVVLVGVIGAVYIIGAIELIASGIN